MADDTAATPPTEPEVPEAASTTPDAVVDAIATATPDSVTAKLTELGVEADLITKIKTELGVTTVEDLAVLAEKDLLEVGMKVVQARRLAGAFVPAAPAAETAAIGAAAIDTILPKVMDDTSWLTALKVGGVLKVDESTVIASVRAALASSTGLYDVPALLVQRMEKFADDNEEQVDPSVYYPIREQLTRRSYAEVFEAIPGLTGNYVTEARKRQLFDRIDKHLWPAIIGFYDQLKSWQEAWVQGAANPALLMASLVGGAGLPPGLLQPPDTAILRDYSEEVANASNRVFAGTGVQIASAMAYDAAQIKKALENPRLPALIGAANRDQMLKMLGIAVSSTYTRLEVNLTRFALAALQSKDQAGGNEELQYFGALYMLGSQIPWDQLGAGGHGISGIGGKRL